MQTHHHTTTCRKKKGVMCRFKAPWTPSNEHRIVRSEENMDEAKVNQSEKLIYKVLCYIVTLDDLPDIASSEILEKSGVTEKMTIH